MTSILKEISDDFPKVPETIISWYPLIFSPTRGGLESIVIGIVAREPDSTITFRRTITDQQLACVLGSNSQGFSQLFDYQLENLALQKEIFFFQHKSAALVSSEFQIGKLNTTRGSSLDHIWSIIVEEISFFGSAATRAKVLSENSNVIEKPKQHALTLKKLKTDFQSAALRYAPDLEGAFNRKFAERSHKNGILIDFMGIKTAANFGVLKDTTIRPSMKNCRVRLWELLVFRDSLGLIKPQNYEFLLWTEHLGSKGYPAEMDSVSEECDAVHELTEEASREELTLRVISSPEKEAERIVSKEMSYS